MVRGGIVLCGGRSTRMGLDKATLPFGPERMLERVVRLLGEAVDVIVVVAAPGQELLGLPSGVRVAHDRREARGPLEGLFAGMSALPPEVDAVYATSCDVPLLAPDFVRRMFDLLGESAAAVPVSDGFHHPLAAVYRPASVTPAIAALLKADRLRPIFLFDAVPTRLVQPEELRDVDPELATLENLNRPEDYLSALSRAGFVPPAEVLKHLEGRKQSG